MQLSKASNLVTEIIFLSQKYYIPVPENQQKFCRFMNGIIISEMLKMKLRCHRPQAPDVSYLAQTVMPWSDLFKIFMNVFAGA